ncbi:RGD1564177 (predicted), isoform CRA_a [Rattus norvegicus]|uniref:RGD1564177 (Predicted), isoform CRA_a n=1 Tax=Rattus norvegicus TaxID=10116 RepID=A6IUY4_RAT|nr:RGD1564177 (predicted), isoform CRA_a [Rattus norvegicus]
MVWSMLTPWRTHPTAQEGPGSLLLREGPGGATSREPWHVCPSSSGEYTDQAEAETTGVLDRDPCTVIKTFGTSGP